MTRIALLSTPRSGNTWVRSVLARSLDLEQIALHHPRDLPAVLPERLILQLHWYREPQLQALLRDHGFRVLVLTRHPLDVLLSILHFVQREPETARWLDGNGALPASLMGATPTTSAFEDYATGWGAENLLSVSYQWLHEPGAVTMSYEALVEDPAAAFATIVKRLVPTTENPDVSVRSGLDIDWFDVFHAMPNQHGWQGRPGLWRALITPKVARRIYRRHRNVFDASHYAVTRYWLTRGAAERNWKSLNTRNLGTLRKPSLPR
jgi:hypothetical protein